MKIESDTPAGAFFLYDLTGGTRAYFERKRASCSAAHIPTAWIFPFDPAFWRVGNSCERVQHCGLFAFTDAIYLPSAFYNYILSVTRQKYILQ